MKQVHCGSGWETRFVAVVVLALLELACSSDTGDGHGGGAGGAGGTTGGGGSAGSGGTSGSIGTGGSAGTSQQSGSCQAQVENEIKTCASDPKDRDFWIQECEDQRGHYEPMGCLPAFDAWVTCASFAKYLCDPGEYVGCNDEENGYFACQSEFVGRTGCSRLASQDDRCAGGTPFAFGCTGALPAGCVPVAEAPTVSCCPALD